MQDFVFSAYRKYATEIFKGFGSGLRFCDLFLFPVIPDRFALIRHDVDRKVRNALRMAQLESELGLRSTYYFRVPYTLDIGVIREIASMGHEIGYHYENLSDCGGDVTLALQDFEMKLEQLRKAAVVQTISMHGRPLRPYDNRDLWRVPERHAMLKERFGILGEVYLDIDYTDIAYINDTGRNWTSGMSNRRDRVESSVHADFESGEELLSYLRACPHPKLVFQVHPERWSNGPIEYALQWSKDIGVNSAKAVLEFLQR